MIETQTMLIIWQATRGLVSGVADIWSVAMVILENDQFLSRLTRMFEKAKDGTIRISMKRREWCRGRRPWSE